MPVTTPDNFLGLPAEESDYVDSRVAILPIPYDATTSFATGTRNGPRAIITASQQLEDYEEALRRSFTGGITTLDPLEPHARGPEQMHERIYLAAAKIVNDGKFLLGLGGEHSITAGLVRAVGERFPKLSVLQLDAHADLRLSYQGSAYSHACVMRRIHEMEIPAIGVGIRSYSEPEADFIEESGYPLVSPRDCRRGDAWIENVLDHLTNDIYVTVDIDGFDPAFAPGTGTPEPGGLDWFQVTDLLAAVAEKKRIVAADVVEVIPDGRTHVTEFLAARVAYRLINLGAA